MNSNDNRDNRASFNGIPEGKEIMVVAMFKRKDSDKIFFAMQAARTGRDLSVKLNFENLDAEEVKDRLKNL